MAKKNKTKPLTNQEKKEWLKRHSERLVANTFKNLEDNLKVIQKDYKQVYNDVVARLVDVVEQYTINGNISNPILLQNKLIQIIQLAVGQLTLLDNNHDIYLKKLLRNYHISVANYQTELIKLARENGILHNALEVNETALSMAMQFPYAEYSFVTGLGKGTFKVEQRLNKILANKIIDGTSVAKIIPQIQEAFEVKQHIAERIARTETSRILNQSSLNIYKHSGINKVRWLDSTEAIKGSRIGKAMVCKECREVATHNGGIYTMEELPQIPLHPHCRCTITPVVE